jgi:hypothetical protein
MLAPMAKQKDESQGQIAWETAEVKGGDLVVEIAGDVSAAWGKRIEAILDRLVRSGDWAEIKVARGKLRVRGVAQGREAGLRHVLDGAVQQANADFAPAEDDEGTEASAQDAEMTAAFRAFADADGDD